MAAVPEANWKVELRQLRADAPELSVRELSEKVGVEFATVKNFFKKEKQKKAAQAQRSTADELAASADPGGGGSPALTARSTKNPAQTTAAPYKCVAVPGKGMGMVATRDIKYGELILEEKPVMTIAGHSRAMMASLRGDNSVFEKAFGKLSSSDQERVLRLHDRDVDTTKKPGGPGLMFPVANQSAEEARVGQKQKSVAGIFRTNCLQAGVDSDDAVLCCEISRFNHSCTQNVSHAFAAPYERVYAVRNIEKGEELCTCYCDPTATTQERQQRLKLVYGFDCACSTCMLPPAEREKSDRRRQKYVHLDGRIAEVGGRDQRQGLGMVREVFELMKEEGLALPALVLRHAYDAYQLTCALGNSVMAKRWIKQAYDACVVENGPDHEKSLTYLQYVKNPKSHANWRG
eukprot:TRINITY_DN33118_c0_g1_i1.p1 TRINITY_DN33118_c0_g1~~TRINITY_DN33118_c0_g1_i1.p1  ORF type:complete len:405 (+),score=58.63 TRINITY_DN33118_c0_g1_i1:167-1381(+)